VTVLQIELVMVADVKTDATQAPQLFGAMAP
jgi:hypothetical protein